jgi:hypothetical protein
MEVWRQIYEFPGYSVSNMGRVRNDETGRIMALSRNQYGIVNVGLVLGRKQYKRSVALLVADAFLPTWESEVFTSPIHLNGDRSDCRAENLMWRPRWFAAKYHRQFKTGRIAVRRPWWRRSPESISVTRWRCYEVRIAGRRYPVGNPIWRSSLAYVSDIPRH